MTQLSFYIVSDVHGYIFPTDFQRRINSYLWVYYMLIYLSNNQAKRRYLFQNRQRRFPTSTFMQLFSIRVTL